MKERYVLTKGPIIPALMQLTMPIVATNFISTTYGLVDMMWIGRLGSGPVAAIGTASFFINLAAALFTMISIGTGVKVAHRMGEGREDQAKVLIDNGFLMSLGLSMLYMLLILPTRNELIGFFGLGSREVEHMGVQFLTVSAIGTVFTFFNTLSSMVLTSMGNSRKPFRAFTAGFLVNLLLDPLLIFGAGGFNGFGVLGAAFATIAANIFVSILFIGSIKNLPLVSGKHRFDIGKMREVLRMGSPIMVQRVAFIVISIIIAKFIVRWGADAIAVQKIGIQIESISYMTIGGLQGAIAAFIGQNYGAGEQERIKKGYLNALFLTSIFGILVSMIFVLFPKTLYSIFLTDAKSLKLGVDYMRIIGFSQLFMCLELMTVGAFNGIGKTHIPPIFSVVLTAMRIPMALMLSGPYGLNGVWMAIALSSVLKGTILVFWFMRSLGKKKEAQLN